MKLVQINATCGSGSTGNICISISKVLNLQNVENYILYSQGKSDYSQAFRYTSRFYIRTQALYSRIFGKYGFTSRMSTKKLISF